MRCSCRRRARAFCPCYTLSSSSNNNNCGVEAAPGTNPSTAEWQPIFQLVSTGPSAWGTQGPAVADIGQGCGKPEPMHDVAAIFPCELLRAIAMQESGWRQFCVPDTPADQVGGASRTIISFDCGYGVGQVTSGMHKGETPAFDRARVAGDPTYNLATGTLILADKWRATNCVGDNQPRTVEDWYVATWAYNGLAFVNNPNNPNYSATRGVCDPNAGCTAPYQEQHLRLDGAPAVGGALDAAGGRLSRSRRPSGDGRDGARRCPSRSAPRPPTARQRGRPTRPPVSATAPLMMQASMTQASPGIWP